MSRRMKKQALFLTFLNAANKKQQTLLLKSLTSDQLDVIGEISLNIYTGVLKISKRDKNELLPYKNDIRLLSAREVSAKKKQIILLKRPNLVHLLIKPVAKYLKTV